MQQQQQQPQQHRHWWPSETDRMLAGSTLQSSGRGSSLLVPGVPGAVGQILGTGQHHLENSCTSNAANKAHPAGISQTYCREASQTAMYASHQHHEMQQDMELLELQSLLLDDAPTPLTSQQVYATLQPNAALQHNESHMNPTISMPAGTPSSPAPPSNEAGLRLLAHLKAAHTTHHSAQELPAVPEVHATTIAQFGTSQFTAPAQSVTPSFHPGAQQQQQPGPVQHTYPGDRHQPAAAGSRITWRHSADVLVDIMSTAATPAGGVGSVFHPTANSHAALQHQAVAGTQQAQRMPSAQHILLPQDSVHAGQHAYAATTGQVVMCSTAVFLTDTSRELLLSVIPTLHAHTAAHSVQLQPSGVLHTEAALLPLGAQVTLQLTGIAADSSMQVVSVSCPEWVPACSSPMPHLIISHAHDMPDQEHAGATAYLHSTADDVAASYGQPAPVTFFNVDELQAAVVAELHRTLPAARPPSNRQHGRRGEQPVAMSSQVAVDAAVQGQSAQHDLTAASPAGNSMYRASFNQSAASLESHTGDVGVQSQPYMSEGMAQQSASAGFVRAGVGTGSIDSLQQAYNAAAPASRQISTDSARSRGSASDAARATRVSTPGPPTQDTSVGKAAAEVSAAPRGDQWIAGLMHAADLSQLDAAARDGSDVDEFEVWMRQDERVLLGGDENGAATSTGTPVTLAAIRDDGSASQSAIASQREGGHRMRVTRLKDISVGDLVEVAPLTATESQMCDTVAVGVVAELVVDDPLQLHGVLVRLQDNTLGHALRVRTPAFKQTQEAWPSLQASITSNSSGAAAPATNSNTGKGTPSKVVVGGIKVLHKSKQSATVGNGSKHTSIASSDGAELSDGKARRSQQQAAMSEADIKETWQGLQKEFGTAICNAVLADCAGSAGEAPRGELTAMKEAIQVLQDQAQYIEQLGDLVARCVSRVEAQADAAAAQALQEQQQEEAQRRGLKGARALGRGRSSVSGRNLAASSPHRSGPTGSWAGGAPRPTSILQPAPKLLRNAASVASHAAAAGLPVKDVETLVGNFPGLSPGQAVSLLQLANGSVAAAVDELMALGLVPGPPEAVDKQAYDYVSSMLGLEDSPALASAHNRDAGSAEALETGKAKQPVGPWADVEWDARVQQLMSGFEGVGRDAAEVALQACSGDVRAAACMLQDSVAAQAQVSKEADNAKIALQLAAEEAAAAKRTASPASRDKGKWQTVGGNGVGTSGSLAGAGAKAMRTATDPIKAKHKMSADKARNVAEIYYNARNLFFQQAAQAYACGDGKAAAEYSRRGKEYGALAKQFRTRANDEAYKAFNSSVMNTFTMDLHGMHVDEALQLLARQVDALRLVVVPDGSSVLLKVITGRGNNSIRNYAAIKHAVLDWLKQQHLLHFLEPGNEGCVIVQVPHSSRT